MYENRSEWRARVFGLRLRFIGEARVEHCLKFKLGNPLPAPIPSAEIQTTTAPDTMADVAEVKDAFESQGYTLDSKVIADEAFALCRQFNLDAFDLAPQIAELLLHRRVDAVPPLGDAASAFQQLSQTGQPRRRHAREHRGAPQDALAQVPK